MIRATDKARQAPELTLQTSPQVLELLERLARSGLYPADVGAVAEELLREKLRELEATGRIR